MKQGKSVLLKLNINNNDNNKITYIIKFILRTFHADETIITLTHWVLVWLKNTKQQQHQDRSTEVTETTINIMQNPQNI